MLITYKVWFITLQHEFLKNIIIINMVLRGTGRSPYFIVNYFINKKTVIAEKMFALLINTLIDHSAYCIK